MNFLNALKTAKSFIDTSTEVYSTIRTSFSSDANKEINCYEKVTLSEFNPIDANLTESFRIFISNKSTAKNISTIFHVIHVNSAIVALRSADLNEAKCARIRLNTLADLAQASVENKLMEKFLNFAFIHPTWLDVHLACVLGLPIYIREICRSGDALSIVNTPTREEGFFPLHLAAKQGFVRIVEILLDFGADVLKSDLMGCNTLHFAVETIEHPLGADVLILISKKQPTLFKNAMNKLSEENYSPLQLAIKRKNCDALGVFLNFDPIAGRYNIDKLFSLPPDSLCLDLLLKYDPDILKYQSLSNNLIHRSFKVDIIKTIADRVPFALDLQLGEYKRTPLHSACIRADVNAAVALISYGANVDSKDNVGDTPLHYASSIGAVPIVKFLLCIGANWKQTNNSQQTPIDITKDSETSALLAHMLSWEAMDRTDHARMPTATELKQSHVISNRLASSSSKHKNFVRLLTLDGGGVRGIITIQILLELEKHIGGNIIDHFDWLAGTSTGAILALALSDGVPARECLKLYLRLKDEVFSHQTEQPLNDSQQPRIRLYSAEKIEQFLQKQFTINRSMASIKRKRVVVTTTRANVNPPELILYRNYDPPSNLDPIKAKTFQRPENITIWKAARCSSAAPTYFPSVDGCFMDGGLVANNPSLDLLSDIQLYNNSLAIEGKEEYEVACLVSLGTGKMPSKTLEGIDVGIITNEQSGGFIENINKIYRNLTALQNLKTILIEQVACSDGHVVERARAWAHSIGAPYFRFTPNLNQDVALDTTDNTILIDLMWTTKIFLYGECRNDFFSLLEFLQKYRN